MRAVVVDKDFSAQLSPFYVSLNILTGVISNYIMCKGRVRKQKRADKNEGRRKRLSSQLCQMSHQSTSRERVGCGI